MYVRIERNLGIGWPRLCEGQCCHLDGPVAERLIASGMATVIEMPTAESPTVEVPTVIETIPQEAPVIFFDAPPVELQAGVDERPTKKGGLVDDDVESKADDTSKRRKRRESVPQVRTSEPTETQDPKEPE